MSRRWDWRRRSSPRSSRSSATSIRRETSASCWPENTNVALKYADYGYILESGRIMMDGPAKALAENKDVKEFYLGMSAEGRKSFRDMKSYRRRKRWV